MFPTRRITTGGGDKFRDEFSLAFDGSNDFIQLSGSHLAVANNFTIVAWVKRGETGSGHCIYSANDSTSDGVRLVIDSNDDLILRLNGGDISSDTSIISEFKAGVWYHVVGVYDDDNNIATLYADGVDVTTSGEASQSRAIGVTATPRIGNRADTNSILFNGNISEVAIYDKALSASEVKTLYNGREPYNHKEGVCSSNLQGWWRMGDGVFDGFPIVQDQANINIGSNLISNPTFDTNTTGWEQYAGGSGDDNQLDHETSIVHSGSGSLKITHAAGNNGYGAKLVGNPLTGTANKLMIIEGYVYIPSGSYSGGNPILTDGGAFVDASSHSRIEADASITNQWQYVRTVQILDSDATGTIFLFTTGDDPSAGDILYWDDISVRMLEGNAGQMFNMTASDFVGESF